ncbi:MFS transporter [Segeticoccus rhizosphaerae]|uniref:MFS transporter n=1 Tax=Segeticoccus rhizosphaerae TaxID=1104777 RepID=UPI0010C13397|nr:MFS transporter [Ornithinicoccus soli]
MAAEQLSSAYALVWGSLAVAGVLAGLIAAATTATVGLPWLFVIDALTCLLCAALVTWQLPETRPVTADTGAGASVRPPAGMPGNRAARAISPRVRGPLALAAGDPRLLRHTIVGTVFALVTMMTVFALPLTVPARGWSNAATGIVLAVEALAALAAQPLVSRVSRWTGGAAGRHRAVRLGAVVLCAGFTGAALAGRLATFALSLAVVSAGSALLLGNLQAGAAALAPEGARAAYLAVFGLSWGVATTAAPVLATQLLGVGSAAPWWVAAGVSLLLLRRSGPRPGRPRGRPSAHL